MKATVIAGLVVAACVAILLADYVVASRQNLQSKVAAEQKRITAARLARKSRDNAVAWVLIAAAAGFITCAKHLPFSPRRVAAAKVAQPARSFGKPRAKPPAPPEVNLTFVDELVGQYGKGKEAAIVFLQAIQSHYGYLPDEVLRRLCELTEITPAQVAGTSSFYGQFRNRPMGRHHVRVCHGTACHVAGARQIHDELRRYLAIPENADTDAERMFTVGEVACVGCCSLAPVLIVDGQTAGRLTPSSACQVVARCV